MTTLPGETYRRAYPTVKEENPAYLSYGLPHQDLCAHHVKNTYAAKRAYIIASHSLGRNTAEVKKLENALGDRHVGTFPGFSPHTPWDQVIAATLDAKKQSADCIITLGGGSLVDGAKAMLLFLANDITTVEDIYPFGEKCSASKARLCFSSADLPIKSPSIPLICIPTTLSGGEFTSYAGGTDPTTHYKLVMGHPLCGPSLVIDDPKLTTTAPEWVWLSTGVRGIDHCVETFCRIINEDEEVDAGAAEGLRLIVPSLLITKKDWLNEAARLKAMLGVNAVLIMLKKKCMMGASHGIGHQLGPLGVGHGETSCILLPSVMKYNVSANAAKQDALKKILWSEPAVAEVLKARGLAEASSDAGDALDAIFRELGMPRSLKEKGIGRDKFDMLAENSLKDPCCPTNAIPIVKKEQVLEILAMCAGD